DRRRHRLRLRLRIRYLDLFHRFHIPASRSCPLATKQAKKEATRLVMGRVACVSASIDENLAAHRLPHTRRPRDDHVTRRCTTDPRSRVAAKMIKLVFHHKNATSPTFETVSRTTCRCPVGLSIKISSASAVLQSALSFLSPPPVLLGRVREGVRVGRC